ncbi:MAG: BatA domain-containing protein [Planctomycetota bacterium]|jgi:hypothetical protein
MSFVTPVLAIAGLVAVAVPILIHLLSRRRRRPIEWAAMRFLLEAFRKHRRRLQLEQILLLAVRCLLLAVLGAALARPLLQETGLLDLAGSRAVFLIIDNGLASGRSTDDGRAALDESIERAVKVVESLKPGDAVGVVTAARPARGLLVPPSSDHRAVISLLESLKPSVAATDLAAALGQARSAIELLEGDQPALVYLLSEFRRGSAALDAPLPPAFAGLDGKVTLVAAPPADAMLSNVQVRSVEPVRHLMLAGANDGSGQVTVRLARTGGAMQRDVSRVTLAGDGLVGAEPRTVQWDQGQSEATVEFMVDLPAAGAPEIGLTASIDDDRLAADNTRHAVLEVRDRLRVLMVDRRSFGFTPTVDRLTPGQWIRRALEPFESSPLEVVEVEPAALALPDVRTADVVIAPRPDLVTEDGWGVLDRFVRGGGLLLLLPPADSNIHQWSEQIGPRLGLPWRISLETEMIDDGILLAAEQPASELLRMISSELNDLSQTVMSVRRLPVDASGAPARQVLVFADGTPMVVAGSPASELTDAAAATTPGLVVYFAVATQLDWTNLPSQPLMVPLFHEIIRQGLSVLRSTQRYTVGEQPTIARGEASRDIENAAGERLPLDGGGRPQSPFQASGLYRVLDAGGQPTGMLAVNIEAEAGRLEAQSRAAVTQWLGTAGGWTYLDEDDPAAALRGAESASPLAGILLLVLLGLVILEASMARWFSHAWQGRGTLPQVSRWRSAAAPPLPGHLPGGAP